MTLMLNLCRKSIVKKRKCLSKGDKWNEIHIEQLVNIKDFPFSYIMHRMKI